MFHTACHGLTVEGVTPGRVWGEKKTDLPTDLKWQIGLFVAESSPVQASAQRHQKVFCTGDSKGAARHRSAPVTFPATGKSPGCGAERPHWWTLGLPAGATSRGYQPRKAQVEGRSALPIKEGCGGQAPTLRAGAKSDDLLPRGRSPSHRLETHRFLRALRAVSWRSGRRLAVVAQHQDVDRDDVFRQRKKSLRTISGSNMQIHRLPSPSSVARSIMWSVTIEASMSQLSFWSMGRTQASIVRADNQRQRPVGGCWRLWQVCPAPRGCAWHRCAAAAVGGGGGDPSASSSHRLSSSTGVDWY